MTYSWFVDGRFYFIYVFVSETRFISHNLRDNKGKEMLLHNVW